MYLIKEPPYLFFVSKKTGEASYLDDPEAIQVIQAQPSSVVDAYFGRRQPTDASPVSVSTEAHLVPNIINIVPSLHCNLRCSYCYAKEAIGGARKSSAESILLSLDASLENSQDLSGHTVMFRFTGGGEPLVRFDVVQKATAHIVQVLAKRYGFNPIFRLSTNGTLINDRVANFLADHNFWVKVSVDGAPDDHQLCRGDSYAKSMRGAKLAASVLGNSRTTIAFTYSRQRINILDRIRFFVDQGFVNIRFQMAMHREHFLSANEFGVFENEIRRVFVWFVDRLTSSCAEPTPIFLDRCASYISRVTQPKISNVPCLAGCRDITISSDGSRHVCNRLLGNPDFQLAPNAEFHLTQSQVVFLESKEPKCSDCWARPFCNGYCYFATKTLSQNNVPTDAICEYVRAHVKNALWAYAKLREIDESVLNKILTHPQF